MGGGSSASHLDVGRAVLLATLARRAVAVLEVVGDLVADPAVGGHRVGVQRLVEVLDLPALGVERGVVARIVSPYVYRGLTHATLLSGSR